MSKSIVLVSGGGGGLCVWVEGEGVGRGDTEVSQGPWLLFMQFECNAVLTFDMTRVSGSQRLSV